MLTLEGFVTHSALISNTHNYLRLLIISEIHLESTYFPNKMSSPVRYVSTYLKKFQKKLIIFYLVKPPQYPNGKLLSITTDFSVPNGIFIIWSDRTTGFGVASYDQTYTLKQFATFNFSTYDPFIYPASLLYQRFIFSKAAVNRGTKNS